MRLAGEIEAGRMWISVENGGSMGMPQGGHKLSGLGRAHDFENLVPIRGRRQSQWRPTGRGRDISAAIRTLDSNAADLSMRGFATLR